MKSNLASVLFVFLITNICFSQNLVLNGSFEEFEKCPDDYSQFNGNVKDWIVPTLATPDFYSSCNKFSPAGVPNNVNGWQKAKEGNSYAGIILLNHQNYREYITGSLQKKLIEGQNYKIKFFISLAEKSGLSTNSIGVLFNSNRENFTTYKNFDGLTITETKNSVNNIDFNEQKKKDDFSYLVDLSTVETFKDSKNWTLVETEFIANGTEKYFTIGNFKSNLETKYKLTRSRVEGPSSYYYIDDVSIEEIEEEIKVENTFKLNSIYTLKSVLFDFDKATLIEKTTQELDELVTYLKSHLDLKVTINGHTDYLGNAAYNQKLSEDRAKSVANYLINKGISKDRINYRGYGESQPIDPNEPEDAQAKNRRVEFVLRK
ncbi:OmpA family protein [Nonlabens xylanidelens]|uniref:OmpA family protein n=1 Tax=Nonlabens xylanidelens TaxID=191564 RepID=UPI0014764251|nr:OmpA family protein [Nonlabens xylanidelens]